MSNYIVGDLSNYNIARGEGQHLSLTAGYSVVFCALGVVAGGGAVYAVADGVSGSLALAFAAFAVFALLLARVLWAIRVPASRGQGDSDTGSGGGGSMVPQGSGPSGGDDGQVDWERFEREFRAYAQRRELVSR